jgi:hypothetical protein
MQSVVFGLLGVLLMAVYVAPSLWVSWRDFRKRYAQMRERAAEYHARGSVEDDSHDAEPEGRAWGMLG